MGEKIKLNNVRLSFPSIWKKATFEGDETKYEATFLLDKDSQADQIEKLDKAVKLCIKENLKGAKLRADKICLRDGDEYDYDGYSGHMSIKAANSKRPKVIDRDKTPLTEDDDVIYAGCYVNAVIELWAQNNSYGKRINANLLGLQFAKNGEPFSAGAVADDDDFDELDDEDDGDFDV